MRKVRAAGRRLREGCETGGARDEEWNAAARKESLGVRRKGDLSDLRRGRKDKRRVNTTNDRWYVTKL